jgi:DNA-binding MarR family transcriptional regulator
MAKQGDYTRGGRAVTALILEVFRLNGHLLTAGDRLTQEIGLTSARWQVLGAIALAGAPQPVANLARTMGLTRQAVQRTANELSAAGLVEFAPNPHHQRAKLVVLTRKGHTAYDATLRRQIPWSNDLAARLDQKDLASAARLLHALSERLA